VNNRQKHWFVADYVIPGFLVLLNWDS